MAVEFTIICDGCGVRIVSSLLSVRDAIARAQLNHGAYCGVPMDLCQSCRKGRHSSAPQTVPGHSVGTHG